MKTPVLRIAFFGLAAASLLSCSSPFSGQHVLAEVNGDKITEEDLAFLGEINPRLQAQLASPMGKKKILDNLVEQSLLYREAVKRGISRSSDVKAKIDLYRRVIIAQSLLDNEVESAAQKYYEAHQDEYKMLELSHIMIDYAVPNEAKKTKAAKSKDKKLRTEPEALAFANELKAQLDAGAAFDKIAAEQSDDALTKARGGSFGKVSPKERRLVARGFEELLTKAFELPVGQVTGPIKTAKGYHLIVVTKGAEVEPFEAVKEQIAFQVQAESRNDLLARLRKEATVTFPEEEKKAESPTPPPAPEKKAESEEHPHDADGNHVTKN